MTEQRVDLQWFPAGWWRSRRWSWLVVGRLALATLTPHAGQPRAKATQLHLTCRSLGTSHAPRDDTIPFQRHAPTAQLPTPVPNLRSWTDIFVCLEQGKAVQPRTETDKHSEPAIAVLLYSLLAWSYLCGAAILKIYHFQWPLQQGADGALWNLVHPMRASFTVSKVRHSLRHSSQHSQMPTSSVCTCQAEFRPNRTIHVRTARRQSCAPPGNVRMSLRHLHKIHTLLWAPVPNFIHTWRKMYKIGPNFFHAVRKDMAVTSIVL